MENTTRIPHAAEATDVTASLPPAALTATEELSSLPPWSSVDPAKERDSDVSDAGEPIERQVFQPGQVFHQVEIVRFVGAGYSGEVYEVRHRITGARHALKIMHLRDRMDARKAERSLAEAHGTFGIQHANVVDVFDIGCEADGTAWMLMEFLDGPTLATILERQGRLSPLFALHVALEVAWGLDAAHENQIIHRDVKPDNIAFTADGSVKVVDFSIAKVIPYEMRTTQRNVRLGTCAYMAPENLEGAEADARFDIYSLGLVLWEMMAGRHPFREAFHDRTLLAKWQFFMDPAPLSEVAGLPAYVDEVIRRATAKEPSERYLTMAEMAQAIIALRNRIEQDEAEGRISLVVPPGEPPIPGRSRSRAVYRPPSTGPTLEVPRREPSAKVVVAPPVPLIGPGGTMPVDAAAIAAAGGGRGAFGSAPGGGAPGGAARTARGTEIMPVVERAPGSRPPPPRPSRPAAVRTTSPMLRQLGDAAEGAQGAAGEAGEREGGARGRREVRVTPWTLVALVLASSVGSALAVRWLALPEAAQGGPAAAQGGPEAAPLVSAAAQGGPGALPEAAPLVSAAAQGGPGALPEAAPLVPAAGAIEAPGARGTGDAIEALGAGAEAAPAAGAATAPAAGRSSRQTAGSAAAPPASAGRGGAAAAPAAAGRGAAAAPASSTPRATTAPGPRAASRTPAPAAPRRREPPPFGESPIF
ncbi:protein kinase [Sorangium sp. So ce296]|uniref:serine/threonine-protein kinase n=1 Tax=Sorangium sp. So ce296 TaxID=3133296 RepID=UPI003F60EE70